VATVFSKTVPLKLLPIDGNLITLIVPCISGEIPDSVMLVPSNDASEYVYTDSLPAILNCLTEVILIDFLCLNVTELSVLLTRSI
ncbi:hypothetical protein, partial [Escherichia coli]|uniref:hypothetical protein n=1 Tax=Escherichia coli TaxID=562 RepID=UPI0021C68E47